MATSDGLATTSRDPATVPVVGMRTYCNCTVIESDGRVRQGSVDVANLMTVDYAVVALRQGLRAWVAMGDAVAVLASWRRHDDR